MDASADREAGFPGQGFRFEVSGDSGCDTSLIRWSGGGTPPTGAGPRFATSFSSGGTHVVTARCEDGAVDVRVVVCEVEAWLARAVSFYGPSIDLSRVKVKSSRLVLGPPGTAWTCNDVVRFKEPRRAPDLPSEATLIHELGHVWEHQAGQAQLLKGLTEQLGRLLGRDPYDFGGPGGVRTAHSLVGFSKESQAQILTELWKSQHGFASDRKHVPLATPGYADDLRRLADGAGIGTRGSFRRTVAGTIDAGFARLVNRVVDLLG
jgi:hypothetical protein